MQPRGAGTDMLVEAFIQSPAEPLLVNTDIVLAIIHEIANIVQQTRVAGLVMVFDGCLCDESRPECFSRAI